MSAVQDLIKSLAQKGEKVLIVGMGVSGIGAAKFFNNQGISCICFERSQEADFLKKSKLAEEIQSLRGRGNEIHFGVDGEAAAQFFGNAALAVLSPGVPLESSICGAISRRGIKSIGELELGVESIGIPAAVVTGSNGKSTTVTLLAELLNAGGLKSLLCGNVGTPVVSFSGERHGSDTRLVVEASSYQLESCSLIKPKVGVFLNLTDNHLERHGTLDRYLDAKANLFARQTSDDFAVLNFDDPKVKALAPKLKAKVLGITKDSRSAANPGALISYEPARGIDKVSIRIADIDEEYDVAGTNLLGLHNRYDIAAALLAARAIGAKPERLAAAVRSFKPLTHRLEAAGELDGVLYINDSKSTTVAASLAAVRAIREEYPARKLTLMIGGLAKAGSWDPLLGFLGREKKFLNPIICFGKDARILASHCKAVGLGHEISGGMGEGLAAARRVTESGGIVLLSPGCASFDEFLDFEDRGSVFKSLVLDLAGSSHVASSI